jgi:hypothetical protein
MKKVVLTFVFFLFISAGFAQFVSGVGFFAGGMGSRHKYKDGNDPERFGSHKGKLLYRLCGGVVGDFFPGDYVKWRSEFEYNMQGSRELVTVDGAEKKYKNKLDYISWNNFMKVQTEIFAGFPYVLAGGRVEYLFKNKPQVYEAVMNDLGKFHFSWDVGAGFEFMAYGPARLFAEYHYHSDIIPLYKKDNVKVNNLTHELRVGVMFRFSKKGESCNAPTYVE